MLAILLCFSKYTCLNFALFASQKVPGMWHSPFNLKTYVDYGNIIHFAVNVWTLVGRFDMGRNIRRMGCLCQPVTPWSNLLQQNESYFHNLHINWDWMDYVMSLEHFVRQKVRNFDVWWLGDICLAQLNFRIAHSYFQAPSCMLWEDLLYGCIINHNIATYLVNYVFVHHYHL